ncbi:hypothetical protein HGM15179_013010 [Zosterops borbonicus]|uniref:NAD(P)(+)--arginine ADP-ribosyltransferase n=1 Tax=Zosterops borbonicus TaxID=364589 RepID=A0A8K1LHE5_9PASS|nr:hypothetical protein HGM15179_013010 [Zosterops borbonicus]
MARDSFNDQYQGCGPAMTAALPALNHSEFQKNPVLAQVWPEAMAEWQRQGSPGSPLSSQDQAIAIMHTMGAHGMFNIAMHVVGRFSQEYWDNFHYKMLHFLMTEALAMLRNSQKGKCLDVFHRECGVRFQARCGNTVRFG